MRDIVDVADVLVVIILISVFLVYLPVCIYRRRSGNTGKCNFKVFIIV